MGMVIIEGEKVVLAVNVGHPIVTDGSFAALLLTTPEPVDLFALTHTHTHTHSFYSSVDFVRDYPCEPVPEPLSILLKQETVSGSGISWAICKSAARPRQITMPTSHH